MSEVRNTATLDMPAGYENLSGIEEVIRDDGSTYYNGVIKLGLGDDKYKRKVKLEEDNLHALWGYDAEDFENYREDPERWELRRRVTELEAIQEQQNITISLLEGRLRLLEGEGNPPVGEPESAPFPETGPTIVESEPTETSTDSEPEPEPEIGQNEDTVEPDPMEASLARIAVIHAEMASSPTPERITALISELGDEQLRMQNAWEDNQASEAKENGQVTEATEQPSRRQRVADWLTLRRPVTYMQTRRPAGGEAYEEEVTETRTNPFMAGALFLGGLALAGFIGYELKHTGHSNAKELQTIIDQNKHLNTEVNNLHQTVNHDSTLINQNHQMLKHQSAVLKQVHEQAHTIQKMERAEAAGGHGTDTVSGGEAKLGYSGDTVWHETAKHLRGASVAKIRKATNYVLKINGLRWNGGGYGVDAHRLPVGLHFKIPSNIVEIANS